MEREWQGGDLLELVRSEVHPFTDRVIMSGPTVMLSPQAAQSFALALHELATNSVKYGALSVPGGRVVIRWGLSRPDASTRFTFNWQERDGPPVATPAQRGFGSTVLEQVMGEYFDAHPQIEFSPGGVTYELQGALEAIAAAEGQAGMPPRPAEAPPPAA